MNLKRVTRSFTAEDWVLVGYLCGLAVVYLIETFLSSSATTQPARRDGPQRVGGYDRVHLGEQALARIEQGDSVAVERWHGGTVNLKGDVVVDVEAVDSDDVEDGDR